MRGRREEYRREGGTGAWGPAGPPHLKGAVVMRWQVTEVVLRRPVPPRLLLHQCRGLPHTGRQERRPPPPPAARPAPAAPARAHRLTDARRLVALVEVGQRVHHHIARHQPRARHAAHDSALCACAGPPPIAAAAMRLRAPPSPRAPPNIPPQETPRRTASPAPSQAFPAWTPPGSAPWPGPAPDPPGSAPAPPGPALYPTPPPAPPLPPPARNGETGPV